MKIYSYTQLIRMGLQKLDLSHLTTHFGIICNLTIHCSGHNVGHNVPKLLNRCLSDVLLSHHSPTSRAYNLDITLKVNYH